MKIKQIIAENKPTMTGVPDRGEPLAYTTVRTQGTYGTKPGGTRTHTGGKVTKTHQGIRHKTAADNPNQPYAEVAETEISKTIKSPEKLRVGDRVISRSHRTKVEITGISGSEALVKLPGTHSELRLPISDLYKKTDIKEEFNGISVDIEPELDYDVVYVDINGKRYDFNYWYADEKPTDELGFRKDIPQYLEREEWYNRLDQPTKMEVLHAVVQTELGNEPSEYKPTVGLEPRDVGDRLDEQGVAEGSDVTENKSGGWSVRSLSPDDSSWAISRVVKTAAGKSKSETHPKKFRSREAAEAAAKKLNSQAGVAEGHADQQRQIIKKAGKPVGEIGIDRESSPGGGMYYMKHYASGLDLGGYDSREEAMDELRYAVKQGVAEGLSWSSLDEGLSIQDKMTIFEEYVIKGNLPESFSQDKVNKSVTEGKTYYGYDDQGNSLRPGDDEGSTEPPNNFAIYINDKKWKVHRTGEKATVKEQATDTIQEAGKKDACYRKVKSRYKVWPSAYASGALVKCRQVGAANWGNKSKKK